MSVVDRGDALEAILDRVHQRVVDHACALEKVLYVGMAANERLDRLEQLLLTGRVAQRPRFGLRAALRGFLRRLLGPDMPQAPVSPFPPPRQETF